MLKMGVDWQRDGYCILCRNLEIEELNSIYDIMTRQQVRGRWANWGPVGMQLGSEPLLILVRELLCWGLNQLASNQNSVGTD